MSNSIERLLSIMATLRNPDGGCPWDLEQDFSTIAPYTIEEAYEVADAIARGDLNDLKDELGDLLLQVVFHAQMASEKNAFTFDDVVVQICTKMIRRHPHVFGDVTSETPEKVRRTWEEIKAEEKKHLNNDDSLLDHVPVALPGLTRAVKLQKQTARVGFDWVEAADVLHKLDEELAELRAELGEISADTLKVECELGDVLFVLANLARKLDIDPEKALRGANEKFIRRFSYIERELGHDRERLEKASLAEMDALWNEAKKQE